MSSCRVPTELGYQPSPPSSHWQSDTQSPDPSHLRYEDGLEVAPSSSPVWISTVDAGQGYTLGHKIPLEAQPEPYKGTASADTNDNGNRSVPRPWYRKKRIIAIIAAAVIATALGVGLGVGLTTGNDVPDKDDAPSGDDSNGSKPDCEGELCARLLSITVHEEELYILGRSANKSTIAFIKHDATNWQGWETLGGIEGAEIVYPPSVRNWPVNDQYWRLDLFIVAGEGNTVYNKWLSQEEDWQEDEWEVIGDKAGSPISACVLQLDDEAVRLDLWTRDPDNGNIIKSWWRQDAELEDDFDGVTEYYGQYEPTDNWITQLGLSPSRAQPVVNCPNNTGDGEVLHSVMWYASGGDKVHYSNYTVGNGIDKWSNSPLRSWDGNWIGEPQLWTADYERTDGHFFGVQKDYNMYHIRWGSDGVFPEDKPVSLNGRIFSTPAFASNDFNSASLDVVALGENGTLVHQHRNGEGWLDRWEDLGIEASSAPVIRSWDEKMWVFALNAKGELMVWTREAKVDREWRGSLTDGENRAEN